MSLIKNDEQYLTAITSTSPNIQKFLNALNAKDERIKWARLERDGCTQSDGSVFRVVSSIRTAKEQIDQYKRGRKGVVSQTETLLFPNKYCSSAPAWKYILTNKGTVKDASAVSTNAWAGQSYHNWGLAVDLVIRKFGDSKIIQLSDGAMSIQNYYSLVGLTQLAKDCGLEWGGEWNDFSDVAHFQDTSWTLPAEEYRYDKNMTFEFVERLNAGLSSGGSTSGLKGMAKAGFLGIAAFLIASIFNGKGSRRR